MTIKLAKQDVEILKLLQKDASISTAAIAERINISQSPCWRRINRLEQEGCPDRPDWRDAVGRYVRFLDSGQAVHP